MRVPHLACAAVLYVRALHYNALLFKYPKSFSTRTASHPCLVTKKLTGAAMMPYLAAPLSATLCVDPFRLKRGTVQSEATLLLANTAAAITAAELV